MFSVLIIFALFIFANHALGLSGKYLDWGRSKYNEGDDQIKCLFWQLETNFDCGEQPYVR